MSGAAAVALSWSGGKDSALALLALREAGTEPAVLLTTLTEDYDRVSMHGVRGELLRAQAQAVGVALVEVRIPAACPNEVYERRMAATLSSPALAGVGAVAFADLFLEDIRAYREQRLAAAGRAALFPIWGRDTDLLAREFVARGFEAVLVCVDPSRLDHSFAGRPFDEDLLADLPAGVDPCGENGEFHTFVHAGPIFDQPIPIAHGETVTRDGFVFHDLAPAARQRFDWPARGRGHARERPKEPRFRRRGPAGRRSVTVSAGTVTGHRHALSNRGAAGGGARRH